jgi:hypothetical protein
LALARVFLGGPMIFVSIRQFPAALVMIFNSQFSPIFEKQQYY